VILGDSETALSAIDAIRSSFTGRIICVPTSTFGQFENTDILNRTFSPLQKNQAYFVEKDYMDRANVEVLKGEISQIDFNKKVIKVIGQKKPIEFDKIMIAWGAYKKRLNSLNEKQFSNVYYLEDRFSHAKCHNEILKAKSILVMGGTFEAYQTASSIREYLDSIGYLNTEIFLMDAQASEV
jgi:thioredoxin reductase